MTVNTLSIDIKDPYIGRLVRAIVMPIHKAGGSAEDMLKMLEHVATGVLLTVNLLGDCSAPEERLYCALKQRMAEARAIHPAGGN